VTGAAADGIVERGAADPSQGSEVLPAKGSTALPAQRTAAPARPGSRGTVIVSSMASDAHTWNLVFLQLLIEELGFDVVNLGATVPDEMLLEECRDREPHLVVLSSVNGHGYHEGLRVIGKLREQAALAGLPVVIGGKLGITGGESAEHIGDLLSAGFDAVYDDRPDSAAAFVGMLGRLSGAQVHELR
jgi:methylaspartate mutase sigma subunit